MQTGCCSNLIAGSGDPAYHAESFGHVVGPVPSPGALGFEQQPTKIRPQSFILLSNEMSGWREDCCVPNYAPESLEKKGTSSIGLLKIIFSAVETIMSR